MEKNWYDIFDTNKHATYHNDKKSVVLVISRDPSEDKKKVEEMKKNPTKNVDKIDWKFAEYDVDVIEQISNIRYYILTFFFLPTVSH